MSDLDIYNFEGRKKESDIDRIIRYLRSDDIRPFEELNNQEKEKLERMMFAERMLGRHFTKRDVMNMIRKKYVNSRTEQPLSEDQAYRIIRETEKVFGTVNKVNPDFLAGMVYDLIMDTIRIAKEKGDVRGLNAAGKNLIELMKQYSEGANAIPPEILDRIQVVFQVNPALLGVKPVDIDEIDRLMMEMKIPRRLDITDGQ